MICRFTQAVESFDEAKEYFDNLSASVKDGDRQQWNAEIEEAENQRLQTPSAMDIMGARLAPAAGEHDPESNTHTPGDEWISLALSIEEIQ